MIKNDIINSFQVIIDGIRTIFIINFSLKPFLLINKRNYYLMKKFINFM
jgi:hypothetical protein